MTIRDIFISLGFQIDESSESEAEQGINKLKNLAQNALGAIGIGLSIAGISSAIKDCVSLSSEVEEMQNKFDVVFQGMTDEVEAWAQTYSDSIGRNKNDIKTYLADQQNLLVGFGMTRQEGAELSKQMTTLALALASFANLDEASAVDNMTKAVMGESEAAKALGAVTNDVTRAQAMQALGLSGSYDKLDQLTKMQVNYQAILGQSPDAIGDCERSLGSYASTVKSFESKLKELKTLIGQFFMPTFQKVISFGGKGIALLRDTVQKINNFADKVGGAERILAVLGTTIAATLAIVNFSKIADGLKLISKGLGSINVKAAAIAGAVLLLVLLIQDFIAFMSGENSLIGSLFDNAGIGADNARQTIINAWTAVKDFLFAAWDTIKSYAEVIWGALTDWWSANGEQVMASFSQIWEGIVNMCMVLWNALCSVAQTIFAALQAFWETWGDTIITVFTVLWNTLISLIQPFLDAIASVIAFFANVLTANWEGALQSLLDLASAVWAMIVAVFTGAWDAVWAVWSKLAEIFGNVFQAALGAIISRVSEIYNAIVNGLQAAINWITSLPAQAVQWGTDIIMGIVNGIRGAIGAVGEAVQEVAGRITAFLHFSRPDEGPLAEYESWMPDFIGGLAQGLRAGVPVVRKAVEELSQNMRVSAQGDFSEVSTDTAAQDRYSRKNTAPGRAGVSGVLAALGRILAALGQIKDIVRAGFTLVRNVVAEQSVPKTDAQPSPSNVPLPGDVVSPADHQPAPPNASSPGGIGSPEEPPPPRNAPKPTGQPPKNPETPSPRVVLQSVLPREPASPQAGMEILHSLADAIGKLSAAADTVSNTVLSAVASLAGNDDSFFAAISRASVASPETIAVAGGSNVTYNITQNVEISNEFHGDRAGQEKSAAAMDKASGDATSEMARALKFAIG